MPTILISVLFLAVSALLCLTLKCNTFFKRRFLAWFLFLSIMIFIICGLICNAAYSFDSKNILADTKDLKKITDEVDVTVEGRVSSHINTFKGGILFFMEVDTIKRSDTEKRTNFNKEFNGEFMVIVKTRSGNLVKRDDLIKYKCILRFDKGSIFLNGYDTGLSLQERKSRFDIFKLRSRIYNCLKYSMYDCLEYRQASICEAVMLGNTYVIPEAISSDFKKSGIYHLLAISGLHVSFFIMIITKVIRFFTKDFKKNKKNSFLKYIEIAMIVFILLIYNFIIGQRASALRATLMAFFVLLALYWGKEYSRKNVLSFSYIFLLVLEPRFFLNMGFWLSFLSVFGLIYAREPLILFFNELKNRMIKIRKKDRNSENPEDTPVKNYFLSSFIAVFSINITVLPLLLYLFGESPVISFMSNVIAIPVFYGFLSLLFVSSAVILIWPPYGQLLLQAARIPVFILLKISETWRYIGFSTIKSNNFETIHLLIYYIVILFVFFIISRSWQKKRE